MEENNNLVGIALGLGGAVVTIAASYFISKRVAGEALSLLDEQNDTLTKYAETLERQEEYVVSLEKEVEAKNAEIEDLKNKNKESSEYVAALLDDKEYLENFGDQKNEEITELTDFIDSIRRRTVFALYHNNVLSIHDLAQTIKVSVDEVEDYIEEYNQGVILIDDDDYDYEQEVSAQNQAPEDPGLNENGEPVIGSQHYDPDYDPEMEEMRKQRNVIIKPASERPVVEQPLEKYKGKTVEEVEAMIDDSE